LTLREFILVDIIVIIAASYYDIWGLNSRKASCH